MQVYEQKVIGGIVRGVVAPSTIQLHPTDFENTDLGSCLAIARQLETDGKPIDPDILTLRLYEKDMGFLAVEDLRAMARAVGSASVVYEAVDRIKGEGLKNKLLSDAAALSLRTDRSGAELLRDLKNIVAEAEKGYSTSENSFVYLKDIAVQTRGMLDDLKSGVSYAVSTGFGMLDELLLDGFTKGDAHIIVGFTGAGKSAMALNCAMNQAAAGMVVGIVSREMSAVENHTRLLARHSNIPRYSIRRGMSDFTHRDLNKAIDDTAHYRIAFDTNTTTVESLRSRVREMVERDGMNILYVDYLQLMTADGRHGSRAIEVQAISRGLKLIAMENKIPVVSLCQFNRGAMTADLFDILAHLKDSSGIEQDASTISYVQVERTEEAKKIKDAKVTILKNRNGAAFRSVEFDFDGAVFTFREKYESSTEY